MLFRSVVLATPLLGSWYGNDLKQFGMLPMLLPERLRLPAAAQFYDFGSLPNEVASGIRSRDVFPRVRINHIKRTRGSYFSNHPLRYRFLACTHPGCVFACPCW